MDERYYESAPLGQANVLLVSARPGDGGETGERGLLTSHFI
jgi:hypothetical protein